MVVLLFVHATTGCTVVMFIFGCFRFPDFLSTFVTTGGHCAEIEIILRSNTTNTNTSDNDNLK